MDTIKEPQKSQEFLKTRHIFSDYSLMLVAVLVSSYFIYGIKVIFLSAISALSCFICRFLGEKILGTKGSSRDFACFVVGVSVAMLLPVTAPWWVAMCGGIFASVVCILPFGNVMKSPFAPAPASICFLILCFSEKMFEYSETGVLSLSKMLFQGNSIVKNSVSVMGALTGNFPSAIGTGSIFVLLGALVFLTIRRPRDTVPAYTFLLTATLWALIFPRVGTGRLMSLIMELCSGMLLFSAVFFMTYPSVLPERLISKALWGFASGIICMLSRYFGFFEDGIIFGIVISQACAGFFDSIPLTKREKAKIVASPEYAEEPETNMVPLEILEEIPDISPREIAEQTEEAENETTADNLEESEEPSSESESLEDVISEENTISPDDTPFIAGGDKDEE